MAIPKPSSITPSINSLHPLSLFGDADVFSAKVDGWVVDDVVTHCKVERVLNTSWGTNQAQLSLICIALLSTGNHHRPIAIIDPSLTSYVSFLCSVEQYRELFLTDTTLAGNMSDHLPLPSSTSFHRAPKTTSDLHSLTSPLPSLLVPTAARQFFIAPCTCVYCRLNGFWKAKGTIGLNVVWEEWYQKRSNNYIIDQSQKPCRLLIHLWRDMCG